MTNELTKRESNEIALDPDAIRQAKMVSGESTTAFMPFIPLLQINNKKKEVETMVDGVLKILEDDPEEGFLLTTKDKETREYKQVFYSKELSAVILKARYQIKSKYKVEPNFISDEFDSWNEIIKVYEKSNQEIIGEGTYAELKELFKTGEKDSGGRNKKSFELFLVLYLDIDGEVLRFKTKMSSYNNWFDYKNSYNENDTFVAYKTNFKLTWSKEGQIGFWYVTFEKGDMIDLTKELVLQKELQMALNITSSIKDKGKVNVTVTQGQLINDDFSITGEEEKVIDYDVSQIPF